MHTCSFSAFPTEDPMIEGVLSAYAIGDYVTANCTSGKSSPTAVLAWQINGAQVSNVGLSAYPSETIVPLSLLSKSTAPR
jgi:hypothetical protein